MIETRFETYCKHLEIQNERPYILALSGGGDSVCLFHLLRSIGVKFIAAHCNYQLRAEESEQDELFVTMLCEKYGVDLKVKRFDTVSLVEKSKGNIQEVARNIRYHWFGELLEKENCSGTFTGHHLNDSIETSLFNFSRGTDLRGLTGISSVNGSILRPLSIFTKKEILEYLASNNFDFRNDSSNFKADYSRNKLRLEILPKFEEIFPDVDIRFRKSLENIKHADQFVNHQIELIRKDLFSDVKFGVQIPMKGLLALKPLNWTLSKIFAPYGFSSGIEIAKLLNSGSGKQMISPDYRLIRHREYLLLAKLAEKNKEYTVREIESTYSDPISFRIVRCDKLGVDENFDVEFDCDTFDLPLTIRTWKQGDYFYPKGMHGKKKISDFYADLKLSLLEKENTWLICSGDKIMHVIGHRQDARFVVKGDTNDRLGIKFIDHEQL